MVKKTKNPHFLRVFYFPQQKNSVIVGFNRDSNRVYVNTFFVELVMWNAKSPHLAEGFFIC